MGKFQLIAILFASLSFFACGDDDPINEEQTDPTKIQGHEFVDLGLSVKWATCNVGADSSWERGRHFAWGMPTPLDDYMWEWTDYKFCKGSDSTFTKYCTKSRYGEVDGKTILEPEDDPATVLWGNKWRTPTSTEIKELVDKCEWTNERNGYTIKGPNGNSIFIPYNGEVKLHLGCGGYWASDIDDNWNDKAYHISFNSQMENTVVCPIIRRDGLSIRPVTP